MDPDDPFSNSWNSLDLKPPHVEFFESTAKYTIVSAKKAILTEHRANKNRNLLFTEVTALAKFTSCRKDKYRSDKGFSTISKIIKAVNRIYQLDFKTMTTLMKSNLSCGFVPSKQLCQWLLIKLLSNGLLLNRTIECCKNSVFMLNHRLRTGHSWAEIIVPMAMISRIWSLATHLIKKCCYSYQKFITIKDDLYFNPKDATWIFSNYHFPKNLENWISHPHNLPSYSHNEEAVSQSFNDAKPGRLGAKEMKHRKEILLNIRKIKSARKLKLFILKEQKRRQRGKKNCVSRYLNAAQWQEVEKKLRGCYKMLKTSDETLYLLKKIRKNIQKWLLNC